MEEIIKKLVDQAGLTEEQALKTMDILKDHFQSMLPPMMHPMIEKFMSGKSDNDDF